MKWGALIFHVELKQIMQHFQGREAMDNITSDISKETDSATHGM